MHEVEKIFEVLKGGVFMIFITGDTHGKYDIRKLNSKTFHDGRQLTKEDYVIITGDFGFLWFGNQEDDYWIKWFNKKPFTTLFVDGNHENFDLLNNYPIEDWNGGKIHRISNSVINLMRGQVYAIDKYSFFTFGGAKSTDREYRKEHISWWKEEMPSEEEYKEGLINLDNNNFEVDYIITHTCSSKTQQILKRNFGKDRESTEINYYFDKIEEKVRYRHWFFGHNHLDEKISENQTIVYNKVVKLV